MTTENFYIAGDEFPADFAEKDSERRARHGQIWTAEELKKLRDLYHESTSLMGMCIRLQRPADGTLIKLLDLGLIRTEGRSSLGRTRYTCRVTADASKAHMAPTPQKATTSSTQEQTMSERKTIEQVTLIQGQDATTLSDEQIFSLIAKTEAKIASLQNIKAKSTKIQAAIDALQKDVNALVEYVDNRVQ